jgi:Kef-type K+ transport system membrane component KefB
LAAVLLVAIAGKFLGTWALARQGGLPQKEAVALGWLMNTRGLTELVILNVGLSIGVISPTLFTLMVLMALITTAMAGPLLHQLGYSNKAA